jgi:hypothetical protein
VQVLAPLVARFERLAYSTHEEVTSRVLLEWKSPGCPEGVRTSAVGAIWRASKLGGLNIRE